MGANPVIKLDIPDINELLRLPVLHYRKRLLKADIEEFIIEEARSFPRKSDIRMEIYLAKSEHKYKDDISPAIQRHFCYRKVQSQKKLKRLFQYGWRILFIALGMLAVIFSLTEVANRFVPDNNVIRFIRESFIILGWVALWRPLEMLLYDWYPVKANINLYSRLEHSDVHIISSES